MNSSAPSTTKQVRSSVRARLASNWIELFAVPIASAIMETQPIFLGLQFFVPHFFWPDEQIPAALTIMFLLLGFHWWAFWNNAVSGWLRTRGKTPGMPMALANLFAVLLALVLLILANMALLNDRVMLILLLVLIGYAWKRGQRYTQVDMDEGQFTLAFKIGFIALLVVMVFALFDLIGNITVLNDALLRDLPIFFLAGGLTLSFSRLSTFKKEQARNPSSLRNTSTSAWAAVMTISWAALVAVSIMLEGLSPSVLQTLFSPLWYLLVLFAILVLTFLQFIAQLLSAFLPDGPAFHQRPQGPQQSGPSVIQMAMQFVPPQVNGVHLQTIIGTLLVVLAFFGLLFFVLKRRKRVVLTDNVQEVRERLDRGAILKERRAERKARQKPFTLEPLEPFSARALYREFLLALAEQGEHLQRQAHETPDEYNERLQALASRHLSAAEDQSAPPHLAVLEELTQAYIRERYGGQQLPGERQGYIRQWLPGLAQYFAQLPKQL